MCFKTFLKMQQFGCTGLLRSSKLVQSDERSSTRFAWNLVENSMSLTSIFRSDKKWAKMAETK